MSFMYGEVVSAIKSCKKESLKYPRFVKISLGGCVFCLLGYIGGVLLCGKVVTSSIGLGLLVSILSFIGFLICILLFRRSMKVYRPLEEIQIRDYLINIANRIRECGIRSEEDITNLQKEIERTHTKLNNNWTLWLSWIKYLFAALCVAPVGFILSTYVGLIIQNPTSNISAVWNNFETVLVYTLVIGAAFVCFLAGIATLFNSIRTTIGTYAETEQVYRYLEDIKYLYRNKVIKEKE